MSTFQIYNHTAYDIMLDVRTIGLGTIVQTPSEESNSNLPALEASIDSETFDDYNCSDTVVRTIKDACISNGVDVQCVSKLTAIFVSQREPILPNALYN